MKITEAIESTILGEAKVVAGKRNLTNEFTWVHSIDHPNVEHWIKPGYLLLSTGYNWPKNEEEALTMIRSLHSGGLAGIVLAVPKYINEFPQSVISLADDLGLPLLELPWEVPFSTVTEELHTLIIRQKNMIIARSEEIHLALTNAALTAHSLTDLAKALSKILKRKACFVDQEGTLLGGLTETPEDFIFEREYIVSLHQIGGLKRIQNALSPIIIETDQEKNLNRRLGCPVRIGGGLTAIIWLDEEDKEFKELDIRALEHAALVAALHISHQRALAIQEERLGYAFVESLLEGQFEDTPSARNRASINGWNPASYYRVCLILVDEPLPLSRDGLIRIERLVLRLRQYFSQINEPALLFASLNEIIFLLPKKHLPEPLWKDLGSKGAAMAVSRLHKGSDGIAQGGKDIRYLAQILKPGRIHHFEEIMFPQALLGDPNARALFISNRIDPLRKANSEMLLETLEVLAEEGFHLTNTSRKLAIHISTLRYRIERIESILNISLDNQSTRFELQVAITLMRLIE
ncbi:MULTISPECIES: PucR family transcriptional regulator [Acinetobacter calcoaceticus/baumannii complex]|uniref:PucR family transcriptional regulator n=1 Tax=Acinetobacter calcoaceticus/baumannii complex TaxID=909768 RepID=UPI002446FA0C|nr:MULTISPECIES: PucR family transcriptional regulator [Acinetobacter calcoaceticus/baumannii complex]MDH2595939.1 PucR family transcriptional regulator ligand-binding domain-containing protein [Acinetobacter baumannii]MDO7536686.1 PucR family transcriptional regulator ligand-binding domain-containing protein [Acinetobacter pittii]